MEQNNLPESIEYIDRESGEKKVETVPQEKLMRWLYEKPVGKLTLQILFRKKILSVVFGKIMDTGISTKLINNFAQVQNIDLKEIEKPIQKYRSFNDFFTRKLTQKARPIIADKLTACLPADGRVLAYQQIKQNQLFQIKGSVFTLENLLADKNLAQQYYNGSYVIVRLAPEDYHRFHFPTNGLVHNSKKIHGHYYSVSPLALRQKSKIFCENKREISQIDSKKFGKILMLEIGAAFVGSILQTYNPAATIKKGEEKGYFKFGGSTIILLFQPDKIQIDQDLLFNTQKDIETKVKMGTSLGRTV